MNGGYPANDSTALHAMRVLGTQGLKLRDDIKPKMIKGITNAKFLCEQKQRQ
jgi:hypothetical protein